MYSVSIADLSWRRLPFQYTPARVARPLPQLLLDAQEAVVLGGALAAGRRAGLDLAGAGGHGQVGDGGVLRLAAAVRDHTRPAGPPRLVDGGQRLGQRADLVELDQHRVGRLLAYAAADALHVGHEDVVAHQLQLGAQARRERAPAAPVLLRHPVLDGDDRIAAWPVRPRHGPQPAGP